MKQVTRGDTPSDSRGDDRGDIRGDVIAASFAAMNRNVAILVTVLVRSAASLPLMQTSLTSGR
jgi:hypothetical protein